MEGRFTGIKNSIRVRELIEHPGVTLRGDYLRTLDIWESKFPSAQMFIGFFDDIIAQPEQLLRDVFNFLDLEPEDSTFDPGRNTKIHVTEEMTMPPEVRRYLASKYLPDLEKLSARFRGHAERWHAEAIAAVAQSLV
jgi:hypothetical protein